MEYKKAERTMMNQEAGQKRSSYAVLVQCALFVALSAAGAFIKIPIPLMPFTLQFLFTNLAGILLGKKYGSISVGVYVLLGLFGIPIFTGGGGPSYIFNPTFGYLVGMCVGAFVAGLVCEKAKNYEFKTTFLAGILNMVTVYLIGFPYFLAIMKLYLGSDTAISALFVTGCLMTVPADILKCAISSLLAKRIKPAIDKF